MNPQMPDTTLALILWVVIWLLSIIITLWILWAIIRGAVLSALRKHSEEQSEHARGSTQR